MRKKPDITEAKIVAKSRLFCVEQIDLRFSNGEERIYERLKGTRRGSVMIIPFLDDETLLLVREYAAGVERYELGFPKGLMEHDENPLESANRELKEEVGYGAKNLVELRKVSNAPGYLSAQMTLVLATDLYPEKLEGDEPEEIEVVPWSIHKLDELFQQPDFTEARSHAGLFFALLHQQKLNLSDL